MIRINDFSLELFKKCAAEGGSVLVSPISVYAALAMAANGADGRTLDEMSRLLGDVDKVNSTVSDYLNDIRYTDVLKIANALFAADKPDIRLNKEFADILRKKYCSELFKEPMTSRTVEKINEWVKNNTDGMIPTIADESSFTPDTAALLLNAVCFKAAWFDVYHEWNVSDGEFNNLDGSKSTVSFMSGGGTFTSDDLSRGFLKYYKESDFCFAAILPNEGVSISDYIAQMDSSTIKRHIASKDGRVLLESKLPKFEFDCKYSLAQTLCEMGISSAFDGDKADFSRMADIPLYLGDVIHKTHIKVDENGTEAAAVTRIDVFAACIDFESRCETVILDRPFIYTIYDMKNDIPVFIGTVCKI